MTVVSQRRILAALQSSKSREASHYVAKQSAGIWPQTTHPTGKIGPTGKKEPGLYRLRQGGSRARGSRVGDDLVEVSEEMAKHLRGEIELEEHDLPGVALTPAQIKAIRLKIASSTKEFERLFGIPARTMESYEQGRRKLDGVGHYSGGGPKARCVEGVICWKGPSCECRPLVEIKRPADSSAASSFSAATASRASGARALQVSVEGIGAHVVLRNEANGRRAGLQQSHVHRVRCPASSVRQ
jgi:putative transcriptional regulator